MSIAKRGVLGEHFVRSIVLLLCPTILVASDYVSASEKGSYASLDPLGLRLIELTNSRYDQSKLSARRQAERKLINAIYAAAGRESPLGESPTNDEINAAVQPALRLVAVSRPANARRTALEDDDPRSKAKVVLHADKREWLIGESLVLHYEVRNEGDLPISVNFGGDYRGAGGRSLRFRVLAVDA